MKSLLIILALVIPSLALSEPFSAQKPVICDNSKTIINDLLTKYGEKPIFIGKANNSAIVITTNPSKATWTILEIQGENFCVLSIGEGFSINLESIKSSSI